MKQPLRSRRPFGPDARLAEVSLTLNFPEQKSSRPAPSALAGRRGDRRRRRGNPCQPEPVIWRTMFRRGALLNEVPSMNRAANGFAGVPLLLAWSLVLVGTSPLFAQQDDPLPRPRVTFPETPPPTFKTTRIVVTVDAVVTDRDGRHVTDLSTDDFEVTVAGKRQQLQQAIYIRTVDQLGVLTAATSLAAATEPPAA